MTGGASLLPGCFFLAVSLFTFAGAAACVALALRARRSPAGRQAPPVPSAPRSLPFASAPAPAAPAAVPLPPLPSYAPSAATATPPPALDTAASADLAGPAADALGRTALIPVPARELPGSAATRRLVWLSGPLAGRIDPLPPGGAWIGREAPAEIRVASAAISRLHLWVGEQQGQVFAVDDRSSNGTFIGTERVTRRALRHGDIVRLADGASFRFEDARA